MAVFRDRVEAGRLLASFLEPFRGQRPVILGLPRGGVVVAAQAARILGAPLDVLVVCRIRAHGEAPPAMVGALAEGGAVYLDPEALRASEAAADITSAADEIDRRVRAYRDGRRRLAVRGRPAVVIDDGAVTGGTLLAAVRALRRESPSWLVAAAPVIPRPAAAALRDEADEVVRIAEPWGVRAIGAWYDDFPPVADSEVVEVLSAFGPDATAPPLSSRP
jgi:putative phosphoribosyl transferase